MNEDLRGRIVVGVHGSVASLAALRWAAREAALLGARLHVVSAWEHQARWIAPYAPHACLPGREEARDVAAASLRKAVGAVLGEPPAGPVTTEVAEGPAARILLERAEGAKFLVLGAGARPCGDSVGPVARACLRRAPCPVVVVSTEMAEQDRVPV